MELVLCKLPVKPRADSHCNLSSGGEVGDGRQRGGLRIHVYIREYHVAETFWEGTGSQA